MTVFGSTDDPISAGLDAVTLADKIANLTLWEVDINIKQHFEPVNGTGEKWLIIFTRQIRAKLGDDYIITHSPIASYFIDAPNYPNGGYLKIHDEVGSLINWYNILYYNHGLTPVTYDSLFMHSTDYDNHMQRNSEEKKMDLFSFSVCFSVCNVLCYCFQIYVYVFVCVFILK